MSGNLETRLDRATNTGDDDRAAAIRYVIRTGNADCLEALGLTDPPPPPPKPAPKPRKPRTKPVPGTGRGKGAYKLTVEAEAEMVRAYVNGRAPLHAVASDYGVSRELVRQAVLRAGHQLRRTGVPR